MSKENAKLINPDVLLKEVETTSINELSKKYQVNPTTIRRKLIKAGYKGKKTGRPIIILYKPKVMSDLEKYSILKLAKIYQISYVTLRNYIKNYIPEYNVKRGRRREIF